MNRFALTYALRFVAVFVGTLVVLLVPVGPVAMVVIGAVIILAVLPDPMWVVRRLKTIGQRKTFHDPGLDD